MAKPIIAVSGYDPSLGEMTPGSAKASTWLMWGAVLAVSGIIFWASLQPPKRK